MHDDSFQPEIASVRRRIENLEERIGALTKYEHWARKKSELLFKELEEMEGILRPIWWLRSWAFDKYSFLISKRVERCERRLSRYEFRLECLISVEEITETARPPDIG